MAETSPYAKIVEDFLAGLTTAKELLINTDGESMKDWHVAEDVKALVRRAHPALFEVQYKDNEIHLVKRDLALDANAQANEQSNDRANSLYANGQADARVVAEQNYPANPFRPRYRKLAAGELDLHDRIKAEAFQLLTTINNVPLVRKQAGQEVTGEEIANVKLAFRHLEDAVYRAVKALTA